MDQLEHCKNCGQQVLGKYCAACGQKVYKESDKSFKAIFHEILHFLTHFEGTIFTSLKTIYSKPGQYSLDYSNGIRKRYFKPVSLFLLIVILYLLFPVLKGLNLELKAFMRDSKTETYFSKSIEHKLSQTQLSMTALEDKYQHLSEKTSKLLLLLLIPLSAIVLFAIHFRSKKYAFDYFILGTELNVFFLLTFYLIMPLVFYLIHWISGGLKFAWTEEIMVIIVMVLFISFTTIAFKKHFQKKLWLSAFTATLFCMVHLFFIVTFYRYILFSTTMWFIH
jgi:hypothetical protein